MSLFVPKNHDLSLSDWGPYSKKYAGVSHVADIEKGLRFDLSVFPALYRRRVDVPSVNWESGWHPWECSANCDFYSYRHELIWKDQLYTDIAYFPLPPMAEQVTGRLIRCEFTNRTGKPVPIALHAMASMNFPTATATAPEPFMRCLPTGDSVRNGVQIRHPLEYDSLKFSNTLHNDHLVADGLLRGEVRGDGLMDGSGLGGRFGSCAGDCVEYVFELPEAVQDARLRVRGKGVMAFECHIVENDADGNVGNGNRAGIGTEQFAGEINFGSDIGFCEREVSLGDLQRGRCRVKLVACADREASASAEPACIAAIVLYPGEEDAPVFEARPWHPQPQITALHGSDSLDFPTLADDARGSGASVVLKYADCEHHYGICWDQPQFCLREILNDELDIFLRHKIHNHVSRVLTGNRKGHFTNICNGPVVIAPGERCVIWGMVCEGSRDLITRAMECFHAGASDGVQTHEAHYEQSRLRAFRFSHNAEGERFVFSQQRMAATTLGNIVFPVYTQRQYVRHRPPGRWWNSLYTWDSGFIGLGILEIDATQAEENLSQYLTAADNPHAAFIQHGSMVPMQILLAHECWSRAGAVTEKGLASMVESYASLRRYYRFFVGRSDGSTMANLESGLLRSWDYFYNSGGWDDYPPQKYVQRNRLGERVAPVITTALAIRCAKSLSLAAQALAEQADRLPEAASEFASTLAADIDMYEADILRLGTAIETHCWDEASGYYAYLMHDAHGRPLHKLLHERSGSNYNMGLDGLFPLVSAECSEQRADQLIRLLFDPQGVWTSVGLCAVDPRAPYYDANGYWSGTVWYPHQWFFWKALLDHGQRELAWRIASRALELWRSEVDESYHCFEHFHIESGRGCGWHQFSGLSAAVMVFYCAYYRPGTLTTGFDALVRKVCFDDNASALEAEISVRSRSDSGLNVKGDLPVEAARLHTVLVCMRQGSSYHVALNGGTAHWAEVCPGTLAVSVPVGIHHLSVTSLP